MFLMLEAAQTFLKREPKKGHPLAEKPWFCVRCFTLFFAISRFFGNSLIPTHCLAMTNAIPTPPKKSYLKTYGRFSGFSGLCHNHGMNAYNMFTGRLL
jgi:hypothetical protein